jgi:hypothetical protein
MTRWTPELIAQIRALAALGYSAKQVCPRCGGSGYTQSIKPVRKLTVNEFLKETASGQ